MSSDDSQYGAGSGSGAHAETAAGDSQDLSASASQSAPDPMVGETLDGRYHIVSKIGEGGMGEVYAAEHAYIEKRVAIKLLRHEIVTNEEAVKRFHQEARSASSIGHKNIISIEDFGKLPDGRIYLCMELLDGQPLNDMLEQPMAPDRLLHILIQTGHGLAAAHAKNIVHRDMKPENIFVTITADGQEVPKLLDFGIAKVSQSEGNNHLTKTGTIFGTPFYMAPEQALGQGVDHRADIYAMGVIMYEVFCGAVPFQGDSFMGILTQHITAEPMPPSQMAAANGRTLPAGIEEIILRAMKKEPEDRYPTMNDMVQDLVKVYRGIAGSGMSSYMQAHVPSPSAGLSAPAYPAAAGGSTPGAPSPTPMPGGMSSPTPMPGGMSSPTPMPAQSGGASLSSTPYPPLSASSVAIPKRRSGVGVFFAVLAVLVVVGGGAAFLILSGNSDDKEKSGDGTEIADNSGGAGDSSGGNVAEDPTKDPSVDPANDPTKDPGADPANDPTKDPGADPAKDPATDPGTEPPPAVTPIRVMVNSRPQGAIAYLDGAPIDKTPFFVDVTPGEPKEYVLKRSGYKDATVSVDGKKTQIKVGLNKDRKSGKSGKGNGKKNPKDDKPKPDPDKLEKGVLGGPDSMLE